MPLIIYKAQNANMLQFVEFWKKRYFYADEHLYTENIGLELTEERILSLFLWKNGTPLSNLKQASVLKNFIERRQELARLQPDINAGDFLHHFKDGGAIWRIFWLHCWKPLRFPIYDQHVHRAMAFIQNGKSEEIPKYDPRKVESYLQRYLPFHSTFSGIDGRDSDKALWAFGKFLNESNFPTITLE